MFCIVWQMDTIFVFYNNNIISPKTVFFMNKWHIDRVYRNLFISNKSWLETYSALLCNPSLCFYLVTKSSPTPCDPMDHSPPGSCVHWIFQARIMEWVAISFSRGSSQPRYQTHVSCLAGRFFTTEPPGSILHNNSNIEMESPTVVG